MFCVILLWFEDLTDQPLFSDWVANAPLHCHLPGLTHPEGLVGHQLALQSQLPLSGDCLAYPPRSVFGKERKEDGNGVY